MRGMLTRGFRKCILCKLLSVDVFYACTRYQRDGRGKVDRARLLDVFLL